MSHRALVFVLASLSVACRGNKTDPYVARLDEVVASVERTPDASSPWRTAVVGDTFVLGSAVRTGTASRARLRIGRDGVLNVDANAVVRFTARPGRRSDVHVDLGSVELEAGQDQVGLGDAVLEAGGRARVSAGSDGLSISVSMGEVLVENGDGPRVVTAGHRVTVRISGAVIENDAPADAAVVAKQPDVGTIAVNVTGNGAHIESASGPQPLPAGEHRLADGTRIAADPNTSLELVRNGARAKASGPSAVQAGGPAAALVTANSGTVELDADTSDAIAAVPGGTVIARSGGGETEIRIRADGGVDVDAKRGQVIVRTAKREQTLEPGESAALAADGTIEINSKGPARVVFSIHANESPVIHDPQAPTAFAIELDQVCSGDGVIEVAKDRGFQRLLSHTRAIGRANVQLAAGFYAYRVRCGAGKGSRGTIGVDRDSGSRPLPKVAPHTMVEADGREYVITYQNLLPELTLAWRDAPNRTNYVFVVQPKTGEAKRFPSTTSRVNLHSGELGEGSYRFWVEIPETGGRSDETRIEIDFDNAAATASIERVKIKDTKVTVNGTVIEGSTVSAGGAPIALDPHQRFSAELSPREGEDGVAIRISHPKLGVHYYVMRER